MTMIAFNVHRDHAEIVTDTLSYMPNGRSVGRADKVHLLGHLDAAMMSQGSGDFGTLWDYKLGFYAQDVIDFDGLDEIAQERLPEVWDLVNAQHATVTDSIIFHLGWSPLHQRFKAYAYASIAGFVSTDVTEHFYAMPAPTSGDPVAPSDVDGWVALAKRMRDERALAPVWDGKVFVGGDVVLTRLEVGAVTRRRIHTFDDTGAEFAKMVEGTLHPLGQLGPCPCGSGTAMVTCHGLPADEPCNCGSGSTFADCCRVEVPAPTTTTVGARAGRNDPCPCGGGSKFKHCCARATVCA